MLVYFKFRLLYSIWYANVNCPCHFLWTKGIYNLILIKYFLPFVWKCFYSLFLPASLSLSHLLHLFAQFFFLWSLFWRSPSLSNAVSLLSHFFLLRIWFPGILHLIIFNRSIGKMSRVTEAKYAKDPLLSPSCF